MKRRKLTGADYVLAGASNADIPYAGYFARMVQDAAIGRSLDEGALYLEVIASRPLRKHEASPFAIITTAYERAMANRDHRAAREVVEFGGALPAKWADYPVALDQHPTLERRSAGSD